MKNENTLKELYDAGMLRHGTDFQIYLSDNWCERRIRDGRVLSEDSTTNLTVPEYLESFSEKPARITKLRGDELPKNTVAFDRVLALYDLCVENVSALAVVLTDHFPEILTHKETEKKAALIEEVAEAIYDQIDRCTHEMPWSLANEDNISEARRMARAAIEVIQEKTGG